MKCYELGEIGHVYCILSFAEEAFVGRSNKKFLIKFIVTARQPRQFIPDLHIFHCHTFKKV